MIGDDHVVVSDGRALTPAAVLVPLVRRPEGWTMLLTLRTHSMPTHPGQISFPGGRIQDGDTDAVAAAIRETVEETGLPATFIKPVGAFDPYRTGTGYSISPIVACIEPGFSLSPDPREVDEVFETPLEFLMNPLNHERHTRELNGRMRSYYAMPYGDRYIWGATAGMIRVLYERLFGEGQA
jgi:8-oxo-dGTP pyrophosphatase MutT (NUDIX family)